MDKNEGVDRGNRLIEVKQFIYQKRKRGGGKNVSVDTTHVAGLLTIAVPEYMYIHIIIQFVLYHYNKQMYILYICMYIQSRFMPHCQSYTSTQHCHHTYVCVYMTL